MTFFLIPSKTKKNPRPRLLKLEQFQQSQRPKLVCRGGCWLAADWLRADANRLLALLFNQGILDEQFLQLQQLQDESSPNFVSEVVNIHFHESEKLLRNLRSLLMDREFSGYNKMGIHLNPFMGSSSSIGAKRIRNVCVAFRAASEQNNRAGCRRALELLEHEYCFLKNKLHELFQIQQQRVLAAGARYPMQN
ncbi:Histidine-containing phosphotransfer protein 6 [Hibiscus syriacus]|uniref:Histidine-containing phosphotransfer protein n=1 Tax=Hibiscus syriacus TaxID=106335 RepID=A0A6A3BZ47_HIBSY|nr:Histidine-containing phosphotransfer protein 6 [Hibiscus syriacus]